VWRDVRAAARSRIVVAALQHELDSFPMRLSTLAYARDLPQVGVELHRLIAVPRLFANAALGRRIDAALETHPAFSTASRCEPVLAWFTQLVIDGVEAALADARPSPTRFLPAGDDWIIVGVNDRFEWRVPFRGPVWPGHYYLLELTRTPITRAVRRAAGDAIARMEALLPLLSPSHRREILEAGLSLDQTLARA
jgi:hypothetical protein